MIILFIAAIVIVLMILGTYSLFYKSSKRKTALIQEQQESIERLNKNLEYKDSFIYEYLDFFLRLNVLYSKSDLMEFTLESISKMLKVEIVLIVENKQYEWVINVYDEQHKLAKLFVLQDIDENYFNDVVIKKNTISEEEEKSFFIEDMPKIRNTLIVPVAKKDKVYIQLINKKDNFEFNDLDQDIVAKLFQAFNYQSRNLAIIDVEKQEADRLTAIIENISDGLIITDSNKEILLENSAARDLFSLSSIKKQFIIEEVLDSNSLNFDVVLFKPEKLTLSAKVSCMYNNERIDKYIISFRNITEMRNNDREKTEIMYLIANNISKSILYLKKMKKLFTFSSDPDIDFKISKSISASDDLTTKLLYYTEIESGPMRLAKKFIDVNEIIENVIDYLKPLIIENKINLSMNLMKMLPKFKLDQNRIEQVFTTLINYICILQEDHEVINKLDINTELSQESKCSITIINYGFYYTKLEIMSLTQKNLQLEKFMKSDQDINELNLNYAFIKHVIDAHGGNIDIISEEGTGTIYKILLPMLE